MQHQGPRTGDLEGDAEIERRGRERHKTAGETGHIDIILVRRKLMMKRREGVEMVVE